MKRRQGEDLVDEVRVRRGQTDRDVEEMFVLAGGHEELVFAEEDVV